MAGKIISFGPYMLGSTLGKGHFAKVCVGFHRRTQKKVALKIISLGENKNAYVQKNFQREAIIWSRLDHPNVVKMLEYFRTNHHFIMVLELMPEDLCQFLCNRKTCSVDERMARTIFRQIASAVKYIHNQGVLHRDIKLENILLDPKTLSVKLTDFGLSNNWSKERLLQTNCGSPQYCAPELHKGEAYSSGVDIWALGVVLYGMIVGCLPFTVDVRLKPISIAQRRSLILEQMQFGIETKKHQLCLGSASFVVKDLISKMLTPDSEKRIDIDAIADHQWLALKNIDTQIRRMINISASSLATHRPATTDASTLTEGYTTRKAGRPVTRMEYRNVLATQNFETS